MTYAANRTSTFPAHGNLSLAAQHGLVDSASRDRHRTRGRARFFWIALLLALSNGPALYARVQAFCGSWFGLILLFGWSWALSFRYLANGVRHLFWDAGKGYSIQQAKTSGMVVILVSLVFTALIWACVIAQQGGAA